VDMQAMLDGQPTSRAGGLAEPPLNVPEYVVYEGRMTADRLSCTVQAAGR
jgi:hypothetical protein